MIRAACWTCALLALLALAAARVYERCELARELHELGVQRDHISTWVCIAYHESRFDTAANNPYSGDHGLFQISELYWCGPGKACGLPCSALRDEDISDDLECALQVHEEHTRLQGDGFLAWVVYPQHCKHNTKKYIVDCDSHQKEGTVRSRMRSRTVNSRVRNATSDYNPNIDNLLPPYLAINSITRGAFGKVLDGGGYQKSTNGAYNWLNFKVDNIDELTLPVFGSKSGPSVTSPRTTTTITPAPTTPSSTYPPIKVWRRIESNQFRKKLVDDKKSTTTKWQELGKSTQAVIAPSTHKSSASEYDRTSTLTKVSAAIKTSPTTVARLSTEATTGRPKIEATTVNTFRISTNTPVPFYFKTTAKPFKASTKTPFVSTPFKTFTYFSPTTGKPFSLKSTTLRTPTWTTFKEPIYERFTTSRPSTNSKPLYESITTKGPASTNTPVISSSRPFSNKPTTSGIRAIKGPTTFKPIIFTSSPKNRFGFYQSSTTTPKALLSRSSETQDFNEFKSFRIPRLLSRNTTISTTLSPFITRSAFSINSPLTTIRPSTTSRAFTTNRPFVTSHPFSTSRQFTSSSPFSTRSLFISTSQPLTTSRPFSTSQPFTTARQFVTSTGASVAPWSTKSSNQGALKALTLTDQSTQTRKGWQSVFDLYLKPTQRPPSRTYIFPEISKNAFRLKIFSDGTTTPAPLSSVSKI